MKGKVIISLICIATILLSLCIPASANSRPQYWEGTDASGLVVREGDIPIVVESELLTFDLPTLPYARYTDVESFLAYDSKVTAEYTFYNPTDMTITATLLFPFGTFPDYGRTNAELELGKHGVYINGEKIEANLRHTNMFSYYDFDASAHLATLSDEFVEDEFYTKNLTVTKYSYEIVGHKLSSAFFNIKVDQVGTERCIVLHNGNIGGYITDSGAFSMSSYPSKNETVTVHFYVFGEPLTDSPDVGWYKHNGASPATAIDGEFRYLGSESTTLNDFIFREYNEYAGISEIDWYNACIARMKDLEECSFSKNTRAISHLYLGGTMRWFEYQVTFQPGEKIKNTVVAPMYPNINAEKNPYEYGYTYLLSPAAGWADFGNLDIVINTPYEMSMSNLEGFEKTETGYKLSSEGLPKDGEKYEDLHFTLLNDGNTPKYQPGSSNFSGNGAIKKSIGSFFTNIFQSIGRFIRSIIDALFG